MSNSCSCAAPFTGGRRPARSAGMDVGITYHRDRRGGEDTADVVDAVADSAVT